MITRDLSQLRKRDPSTETQTRLKDPRLLAAARIVWCVLVLGDIQ